MRQVKLQDICEEIVNDVDGALGCALVDLDTGLPLALDVKPGSLLDATAMQLISAAGVTWFEDNLSGRSGLDAAGGPADRADFVQEIQATTEGTYNYMSLVAGEDQELLILITDRGTSNLGLGWMAMRQALVLVRNATGDAAAEPFGVEATAGSAADADPQLPRRPNPDFMHPRARGRRTIWGQR